MSRILIHEPCGSEQLTCNHGGFNPQRGAEVPEDLPFRQGRTLDGEEFDCRAATGRDAMLFRWRVRGGRVPILGAEFDSFTEYQLMYIEPI